MSIPDYLNRTPNEILSEKVYFDSAGYAYRGLSWLDYSKKHTDVQALQFAALSTRFSIESIIFETIIISVGRDFK